MTRTAQISKEIQQSIITLRHESQSKWNIYIYYFVIYRNVNVSSSAVAKTIRHYDDTGSYEDRHRKGRPRVTSAAEDKFIRVICTSDCSPVNASQSSNNRHISISTIQRKLRESGIHGQIAAKKPLL